MKRVESITYYKKDGIGYTRKELNKCFVDTDISFLIKKFGVSNTNTAYVSIHLDDWGEGEPSNDGDMVVLGNIDFTFDNSNEKSVSDSMRTFRKQYSIYTVNAHTIKKHGSKRLHHVELYLK